jgi:hypothetical protein
MHMDLSEIEVYRWDGHRLAGPGDETVKSRIMYVEYKAGGLSGPGWVAHVTFSKSRSSVYFRSKRLPVGNRLLVAARPRPYTPVQR